MAQNQEEYKKRLESFVDKNDLEFEMYKKAFEEKNPKPIKYIYKMNMKFYLALVSGLSAATLSGLRIFDRFYQVAFNAGGNANLSLFEALAGIGAVNITILALSFGVAYTKKKMSERSMNIGLWVAVAISAIAGLGQSFYGLKMDSIVQAFDWILAISLASVTALEYLSGDMLGVEFYTYEHNNRESEVQYILDYKHWLSEARKQFPNWKMQFTNWDNKQLQEEQELHNNENNLISSHEQKEKVHTPREYSKASEIIQLLDDTYQSSGELPSVTQIVNLWADQKVQSGEISSDELQKFVNDKKGYVSVQLNKWANKHSDLKTKMFIKKFIRQNIKLPSTRDIMSFCSIGESDANFFLAEFIVKNKAELTQKKVVLQEDVTKALEYIGENSNTTNGDW
jgi:hypothetical protein